MRFDFHYARLGKLPNRLFRLGLSASYRPGRETVFRAADLGVNLFFLFGFDGQMISALRDLLPRERERYVVATGAYNYVWGRQNFRRTLEKRLRQLRTDYLDLFLFLGVMQPEQFAPRDLEALQALREDSRVRAVGCSIHHRRYAGQLAAAGAVDVLMVRYNAAHRGAEEEIFPFLEPHRPGILSYTATRWTALLRPPKGWTGPVPDAGLLYRFVLSNPHVDVCLTAPRSTRELEENVRALERGPLDAEEISRLRAFGDAVHAQRKWFL